MQIEGILESSYCFRILEKFSNADTYYKTPLYFEKMSLLINKSLLFPSFYNTIKVEKIEVVFWLFNTYYDFLRFFYHYEII